MPALSVFLAHRRDRAGLSRWQRGVNLLLVVVIAALSVLYLPAKPAAAEDQLCTIEEFRQHPIDCAKRLAGVAQARLQCLDPPTPQGPSSGLAGYFASKPEALDHNGVFGLYTMYGYAGMRWHTYGQGCASTIRHPDDAFGTTVANFELSVASAVIGAANALRGKAWEPAGLWSWADPLVAGATQRIYEKVFTVWGVVVLAVLGLYLIWQSRKASISKTFNAVGWALMVMVAVTAITRWPVASAHVADSALTTSVTTLTDSLDVDQYHQPGECHTLNPDACVDHRTPALRASDTATDQLLYQNWLRGTLGSADSPTANKYGFALYEASSLTWDDEEKITKDPSVAKIVIQEKQDRWNKIAEQIRNEDPAAYSNLTGEQSLDRVGYGLFALVEALCYAAFDIVASLMVLLGFGIVRWAVISAPLLGTVGMLLPAAGPVKKLANAVVISVINVVVFSAGGAAYVSATNLIMDAPGLPSWVKLLLIVLTAMAGWGVLRKYRRVAGMAQLHDPVWMHRRLMRQMRRQGRRTRHTERGVGEEIVDAVEDHGGGRGHEGGGHRTDGDEVRWGRHRSRTTYYGDNPDGAAEYSRTAHDEYADDRGLPSSDSPARDPRPAPHADDRVDGEEVRGGGRGGRTVVVEVEQEAFVYRPGSGQETGGGRPGLDEGV